MKKPSRAVSFSSIIPLIGRSFSRAKVIALSLFFAFGALHFCQADSGGSLINPRYLHTATLLADGRVLVVGGYIQTTNGFSVTDTCEIYNPAPNTWTATGSLHEGRYGHGAVLLSDGRVLVAGGDPALGLPTKSAEIYDPAKGTWMSAGQMLTRRGPDLIQLPNGKVLAAGGSTQSGTNCELFDPATGNWSVTGSLMVGRGSYRATRLEDGRVLVAGGHSDIVPGFLQDCELYDSVTEAWSETGMLNRGRSAHGQVLLANGQVLVAGGLIGPANNASVTRISEIFDPATGAWSLGRPLTTARYWFTANLLPDGNVFAVGGADRYFTPAPLGSIEEYEAATGRWHLFATTLASPRFLHTATTLLDGSVLVAGGLGANNKLVRDAEIFITPQ